MRFESVDPRDTSWECPQPVYRVYFWSGPGLSDEYRLVGASDVHEAIAWADERLPDGDQYLLYVEQSDAGRLGLVRLAGTEPTAQRPR